MSVHRRTIGQCLVASGQWIVRLFYGSVYPHRETGWERKSVYPVPVQFTPAAGHSFRLIQATGPMVPVGLKQLPPPSVQITRFDHLTIEQMNHLATRLSPDGIAALPTLPASPATNRTGMLPPIPRLPSASRPPHSMPLRPLTDAEASPAPIFLGDPNSHSSPLRGSWQAEQQAENLEWLTGSLPTEKKTPSGFLLASPIPERLVIEEVQKAEILAVTEQDMQPDLSEDEPTRKIPAEVRNTPSLYILLQQVQKASNT